MILAIVWAIGFVLSLVGWHLYQKLSPDRDDFCEAAYGVVFAMWWPGTVPMFVLYLISKWIGRLLW